MQELHVYYDTRYAPVTFDYSNFLVSAEAYRQSIQIPRISLNIISPSYRSISHRDTVIDDPEKKWRVNHILTRLPILLPTISKINIHSVIPDNISLPTFPTTYPPRSSEESAKVTPYLMNSVNKYYGLGCNVQPFDSSKHAKKLANEITSGDPYYTISLRTSKFQTARNSNLEEWYKVYKFIENKGYQVFVIPDFEDTLSNNIAKTYDWKLIEFATYELDLRLAMYQGAIDNLCVNNGTSTITYYSNAPVKMFKVLVDGIKTTSEQHLLLSTGLAKGESPPFCKSNQKWIWKDDNSNDIIDNLNL